ncbi:uncharacterized protein LOC110021517 isoform X2 [Phalaenopsis equestris]|uniref:uncharacterized protein LOC110021517 isoform X2 n=1 Tax=Phalaenopsis equestris TaxID=78828 RepID=UPI0009E3075D|nr:uncharacterized protein LOC110021517 isoform X2 [Phalaenopsis equestris]
MWGRFYWLRKEEGVRCAEGIVVLFAWLFSQERHLKAYVDLYWSLGWDCLVCHVDFLTQFFPEKATERAFDVVDELIKEAKIRPKPIVLASFSAGSKGYFYKVLQLIEGKYAGQINQIYDSSPVDFTNDLGLQFALHPSVLKMSYPPRAVAWMAKAFGAGLDALFLSSFEAQRAEYWQALYSSVSCGPFIILCSEDDKLAPSQTLDSFAQRLQELGADVNLIKWTSSPHVAHYRHHKDEYNAAVTEFLAKASINFSNRLLKRAMDDKIPKSVCYLHDAAFSSNESLRRVAIGPSDYFYLPSSMELSETKAGGSLIDEQKAELFQLPSIKPQGILSQVLFDVCVPKNIEGWDIKQMSSLNRTHTFGSARRHGPFNPIKCIKRSRL